MPKTNNQENTCLGTDRIPENCELNNIVTYKANFKENNGKRFSNSKPDLKSDMDAYKNSVLAKSYEIRNNSTNTQKNAVINPNIQKSKMSNRISPETVSPTRKNHLHKNVNYNSYDIFTPGYDQIPGLSLKKRVILANRNRILPKL